MGQSASSAKLGGVGDEPESCAAIQRDFHRLGNELTNLTKFMHSEEMKRNAKSCTQGGMTPSTSAGRGPTGWKATLQNRTWGSWWATS